MEKVHKVIGILISLIVFGGVIYAFTSSESILLQDIKATPTYMKVIGGVCFALTGVTVWRYTKADTSGWQPFFWMIAIALLIVFGLMFISGFGNYTL